MFLDKEQIACEKELPQEIRSMIHLREALFPHFISFLAAANLNTHTPQKALLSANLLGKP